MAGLPRTAQPGDPDRGVPDPLGYEGDRATPGHGAAGELSLIFGDDFPDRANRAPVVPDPGARDGGSPASPTRNPRDRLAGIESSVRSLEERIGAVDRLLRLAIERLDAVQAEARAAAESSHQVVQSLRDLPDRPFG